MKIYLVNLDKNQDRLRDVDARLTKLGITYERIPAVYGKALSDTELKMSKRRFRMWCALGYDMEPGQIGCALSHVEIYRRLLASGEDMCCCLEDDVYPDERFAEQLRRVSEWVDPTKPQVVLLTNYTKEDCAEWTIRPAVWDHSTEAYVITAPAARNILRTNYPVATPADWWGYRQTHGLLRFYHAFPTVFHHDWMNESGYQSDVCTIPIRHPGIKKLIWKLKRIVGKTLDRIMPL